jgi:phage anti-repressor protein
LSTDSNQDIITQFCIYASLQSRGKVHTQTFNIGDYATPLSWEKRWPILASYFGLECVGPSDDSVTGPEYVESHQEEFQALCKERGLKEDIMYTSIRNTGSRGSVMKLMDFDRNLDLSKARALGFEAELSTESSWYTAFDRMREAKLML